MKQFYIHNTKAIWPFTSHCILKVFHSFKCYKLWAEAQTQTPSQTAQLQRFSWEPVIHFLCSFFMLTGSPWFGLAKEQMITSLPSLLSGSISSSSLSSGKSLVEMRIWVKACHGHSQVCSQLCVCKQSEEKKKTKTLELEGRPHTHTRARTQTISWQLPITIYSGKYWSQLCQFIFILDSDFIRQRYQLNRK